MNISEAARRSGLSAKTIRYYEDIELIAPASRGDNGYRQYDARALGELQFLSRAREVGFDLDECRQLLDLLRNRSRQSRHARDLVLEKTGQLQQKIDRVDHPREMAIDVINALQEYYGYFSDEAVAQAADAIFAIPASQLSAPVAWLGILCYALHIYFDFSGYSDMAIGLGRMLGFQFLENFNFPFLATNIQDFWRRWHITLSNWFRDYLYLPLGGSRRGTARTVVNLWIVFVLVGIWHGANWTFLLWGVYHGALLSIERLTGQRPVGSGVTLAPLRRILVLLAVMIGWVMFRSPTAGAAIDYLAALFTSGGVTPEALTNAIDTRAMLAMAIGIASVLIPGDFVGGLAVTVGEEEPRTSRSA